MSPALPPSARRSAATADKPGQDKPSQDQPSQNGPSQDKGHQTRKGWAGRPPMSLRLGNPSGFFRVLNDILGPLAFLRHLILPGVALALGVLWFNWFEYLAHVDRIYAQLQFWQTMLITILTAALFGRITQGVVMHRHGAVSVEWGIKLSFGVIPRFYIAKNTISRLDFRSQRACHAASLQFRLVMFITGMLVWDMTRRNGTGTADFAVVMASVGLGSFLFIANPLWPADGYLWLAARLERPKLRQNAFRLLSMVFRRQPLPETLRPREFWLLLAYAVVSIVFTAFILFTVLTAVAYMLESSLRGTGMVIFALLLASVSVFLLSMRERSQAKKGGRRSRSRSDDQTAEW